MQVLLPATTYRFATIMMLSKVRLGPLVLIAVVGACSLSPTNPDESVLIETTESEMVISDQTIVVAFTIINTTRGVSYYVAACGDQPSVASERRQGSGWVQHSGGFCLAVYSMVPMLLKPGQEARYVTGIRVLEPGVYRISIRLSTDPGQTPERLASNSFFVR